MNRFALTASALLMVSTTACLDVTRGAGELGHVTYSLYTDYDPGNGELTETPLLVNHEQSLYLSLTEDGEGEVNDFTTVTHSVSPSEGVTIDTHVDDDELDDIDITVEEPGLYTITTEADGQVLDYITVEFAAPEVLHAATWLRAPGDEEFVESDDAQPSVDEGTQVTFVAIPYDAEGRRIAGRFEVSIDSDPEGAVVEAFDTFESHEDHVYGSISEGSVYFIEPGEITLTVSDDANGVSLEQTFDVAAW